MKRLWSGRSCDRQGIIPEVGGLHTSAEAAASLSEDCVQAVGDIALGCSNISVLIDDGGEVRADCASLAFLSRPLSWLWSRKPQGADMRS